MSAAANIQLPPHVWAAQLPLREAWNRAAANGGMPGVDGVSTRSFARAAPQYLRDLTRLLASGRYIPWPLRQAHADKKDGSQRRLLVPAVSDRIVQSAVAQWLAAQWERRFDASSHGYRPGRGVATALRQLRQFHRDGYAWVFDADIRSFFDSIPHSPLLAQVAAFAPAGGSPWLPILDHWLAGPVWDGTQLTTLRQGISQGSPLSPLLANCYLHAFDEAMRRANLPFIRYADDFLVLAKTPFELPRIRQIVEDALGQLGLQVNAEKTRFTSFDQHFRFLGAEMQGRQILLPFEKEKFSGGMEVAGLMPPELRRRYRAMVRQPGKPLRDLFPPYCPPTPAATTAAQAQKGSASKQPSPMAGLLDALRTGFSHQE